MTDVSLVAVVTVTWTFVGFIVALALGRILRYQSPHLEEDA
jgi:hypothetical protein